MNNAPAVEPDFRALFETAPSLYLVFDPTFHIIAASDAYLQANRTNRHDIIGRHIFDVFPASPEHPNADAVRQLHASLSRVLHHRVADAMVVQRYDIRRPEAEGGGFEVRYWSPFNSPVLNQDGSISCIIHRVEDVTGFVLLKEQGVEQTKSNNALRERAFQMEADLYLRSREVAETNYELKKANEDLTRLYEKTRQLALLDAATTEGVAIHQKGRIIIANEAFARIYGYDSDEVAGMEAIAFIAPEARETAVRLATSGHSAPYESIGLRKDGSRFPVEFLGKDFPHDGENKRVGLVRDLTEIKRAEEALRQSDERYRALIKASSQVLYSMNPDWSEMRQLRGGNFIADTEITNPKWFQEYIPPEDQKMVLEAINKSVRDGSVFELEHRVWRVDGAVGWTYSRAVPVQNAAGEIMEWFGAASDITERKQAEKELQRAKDELEERVLERTEELARALQDLKAETEERVRALEELREKEYLLIQQNRLSAMGEMIANIAHQWRQPLNVLGLIIQQLPLFQKSGLLTEEEMCKAVDDAMQVINHMSATIDDFRGFFKPDKERSEFHLVSVVTSTIKLIEAAFISSRICITVDQQDDPVLFGYPNEYSQVILNILNNAKDAFEHCRTEKPCITVTASMVDDDSVLTIRDNAGGIPEDIIYKIFDPHFTTKGTHGTGIGLFMAKNIIEKSMNGSMSVRNIPDGAEFVIRIKCCGKHEVDCQGESCGMLINTLG